jgi:hypothetical protein
MNRLYKIVVVGSVFVVPKTSEVLKTSEVCSGLARVVMSRRIFPMLRACTSLFLLALVLAGVSPALAQKAKDPLWTHAFDVKCRKLGENDFSDKTRKFAFEVFKDPNTGYGLYISQVGSFAAAPGFADIQKAIKDSKRPEWLTGLDLPARKAGEQKFSKDTRVHSLEVFRDANTNNWVYVTEKGLVAVTPAQGAAPAAGSTKAPKFVRSIDLSSRKAGKPLFKDAHKFGIEVYRDDNTASLIYICDTGAVAVLPDRGVSTPAGKAKDFVHLYGLDLPCRKHNEPNFGKETRKFALEVYRDENNGNLIYLCETGSLAVLPEPKKLAAPTLKVLDPEWTHALNLRCRTVGERDFTDKTRSYGAEVSRDDNTGVTLYIAETGSISAVPTK